MRTSLSASMLEAMNAQETGEVILPLVKLTQDGWNEAIRIVPNLEQITHLGEVYDPLAFEITLPDEEEAGVPVVEWRADNTDRRMVEALRAVDGTVKAEIVLIRASDPDTIEVGPIEVEMRAARYDAREISGTMGVEPILERPFGHMILSPKNAPALF